MVENDRLRRWAAEVADHNNTRLDELKISDDMLTLRTGEVSMDIPVNDNMHIVEYVELFKVYCELVEPQNRKF